MNTQNIKLLDVPATFSNLPEQGGLRHFNGEPWVPNMAESHVQGIAHRRGMKRRNARALLHRSASRYREAIMPVNLLKAGLN